MPAGKGKMIQSEKELLRYLDQHQIAYQRMEHPPVFTCEQADQYRPDLPGSAPRTFS